MNITLIQRLNGDHARLIELVKDISSQQSFTAQTRILVGQLKLELTAHLRREEAEFYPVMRKAAEQSEQLQKTLEIMGLDMEKIAQKTMSRIDAWLEMKNTSSFVQDFAEIASLLAERIKREEHSLYSKFLKLNR